MVTPVRAPGLEHAELAGGWVEQHSIPDLNYRLNFADSGPARSRVEDLGGQWTGGPFARGLPLYLRQPYHRKTGLL